MVPNLPGMKTFTPPGYAPPRKAPPPSPDILLATGLRTVYFGFAIIFLLVAMASTVVPEIARAGSWVVVAMLCLIACHVIKLQQSMAELLERFSTGESQK